MIKKRALKRATSDANYKPSGAALIAAAGLGQGDQFVQYSIDVPAGFTSQPLPPAPGTKTKAKGWAGPAGSAGLRVALMVTQSIPLKNVRIPTVKEASEVFLAGLGRTRDNWKVSASTNVRINGVDFIKTLWTGVDKTQGVPVKGTTYTSLIGKQLVTITVQGASSGDAENLKLAESAALTFNVTP